MRVRRYDYEDKKSQLGCLAKVNCAVNLGISSLDEKNRLASWSLDAVSLASFTLCSALGGFLPWFCLSHNLQSSHTWSAIRDFDQDHLDQGSFMKDCT